MSEETLNRIATALERVASALEAGCGAAPNFCDHVSDMSRAIVNIDKKGIDTFDGRPI
jgi:hypothetical protein